MNRLDRARQFAPFDALKGLSNALRLKEIEHDKIEKGILSEEDAKEISSVLMNIERGDIVRATYFKDGYYKDIQGCAKLDIENGIIEIMQNKIPIENLYKISKVK